MQKIANVKCCFHKLHVSALPKLTQMRVVNRLSEPTNIVVYQHLKKNRFYITYQIGDVVKCFWSDEFDFDLHLPLLLEIISNTVSAYNNSNERYLKQPLLRNYAML